jgi:hypothetical protein
VALAQVALAQAVSVAALAQVALAQVEETAETAVETAAATLALASTVASGSWLVVAIQTCSGGRCHGGKDLVYI